MNIKLAVIGSRSITNRELIYRTLDDCNVKAKAQGNTLVIVSGGARGVDTIAEDFAKDRGLIPIVIKAAWQDAQGNTNRAAGYERNELIWDVADCGVAFWDGESKGTAHSFKLDKERNKTLKVVKIQR